MNVIKNIWNFYYRGFKDMPSWGRKAWLIIIVKLFIMFAVLKLLFFPNFLNSNFETDGEKANFVIEQLTK